MTKHRTHIFGGASAIFATIAMSAIVFANAGKIPAPGAPACCDKKLKARAKAGPDEVESSPMFEYVAMMDEPATVGGRRQQRAMPNYKVAPVENGGTIEGVVKFVGRKPEDKKLNIVKDYATCEKGGKSRPLIRTDEKGLVADAVVYLFDITQGLDFPKREKPPLISQHNCSFEPHVMAVKVGEPVEILNSDVVAHNINASQRIYTLFNILQPQKDMKSSQKFDRPGLVNLRCNVHDWMEGWVWVFRHPYNHVTGVDGGFKLDGVPPGKYQLAVWQETLGEQFFTVEVKAGETTKLDAVLKEAK